MSFNKKFFTTGGIVASAPPAAAAFDPLQNFETVTYTGNGSTQKITGYIRKGAAGFTDAKYITFPNITGVIDNSTNTDFAISLFFNLTSIPSSSSVYHPMFGKGNPTTSSNYQMLSLLLRGTSNTDEVGFEFRRGYGGATYDGTSNPTTTLSANTWYHLLINYTASTKVAEFFINNTSIGSDTISSSSSGRTIENGFNIGSYRVGVSSYLQGKVDQFRIFNTPITDSADRQQLAAEDYSKATKSTTDYFGNGSGVALYELDDDANSSNFEQAASFNGSSSRIALPKLTGLTADVSVSGWVNLGNTTTSNRIRFITLNLDTNGFAGTLTVMYRPSDGEWQVRAGNGTSSNATVLTHTYPLTQSTWYHICFTRNDSSNETIFYVNGSEQDTESVSVSSSYPANATGTIGDLHYSSGLDYNWLGEIDQVRIYSSALGSGDVTKLYKESADVPTSNLVAHYKLDGDATDETENYDGTETSITYSAGVYGGTPTNVNFLGMAFQPDLVWIKERTSTSGHFLSDSVRGATKVIYSNLTNEEDTETTVLTSFDTNGFSVGSSGGVNAGTDNYVAWCWKAGGVPTPNNNTQGTTPSTVSANQDAGFSIVKFPVTNTSVNVGHGLLAPPEMIIYKNLTYPDNWYVYHKDLSSPNTQYLNLNLFSVATTNATYNFSSVTSTTFTSYLAGGGDAVCYCFHSVDEYQKVGSYSGDSSTVTVTTGFEPRFVMIKRTNTTSADWILYDQVRSGGTDMDDYMTPNSALVEQQNSAIDITAIPTGFTVESGNWQGVNILGGEYIYLAIA